MTTPPALWVMGDVHGALPKLRALLLRAGLLDGEDRWTGGRAHLVFLGDYMDRGPDGAGVVHLMRRLESQARAAGGQVSALLGNHEVMVLAALRFARRDPHDRHGLREYWLANGGRSRDAEGLSAADRHWLLARPALARAGDWLLLHADSPMYLHLGGSVEAVNAQVRRLLHSDRPEVWSRFATVFADRLAFAEEGGEELARELLRVFGGERLVHGHTPVPLLAGPDRLSLRGAGGPLEYAGGRCVALDGGLAYWPQAGFLVRLEGRTVAEVVPYPAAPPA